MQLVVVLAVLGLANFVGVRAVSEHDLAQRGVEGAEYRTLIEVEDVSGEQRPSLIDAINR